MYTAALEGEVQEGRAVYVYGGAVVVVVVVVLSVWIYGAKSKITVPAPYG